MKWGPSEFAFLSVMTLITIIVGAIKELINLRRLSMEYGYDILAVEIIK